MWNKLTRKSSDVASESGGRRRKTGESSSSSRRRPESVVSTSSTKDPDEKSRRRTSRTQSYTEGAPSEASYTTARTERTRASETPRSERKERTERRSAYDDDRDGEYERDSERRERDRGDRSDDTPTKRKSTRDREDEDRGDRRQSSRSVVEEPLSTPSRTRTADKSDRIPTSSRQDEKSSRAPQPSYPGQASSGPSTSLDSHVQSQFPGQDPSPLMRYDHGFGAAADYYGDQGQSVEHQPGIRPSSPKITAGNAQPHLMAALTVSTPAPDTGNGSAADFYSSSFVPPASVQVQTSSAGKPNKPTKQSSGSGSKPSKQSSGSSNAIGTTAALAGAAAVGYGLSHQSQNQSSTSIQAQYSPSIVGASYGANTISASPPTMSAIPGKPSGSSGMSASVYTSSGPSRPPNASSDSNFAGYAAGAAGLAAGAYALHQHHSTSHQHHQQHSNNVYGPPSGPNGRPTNTHSGPYSSGAMMTQHQHRGPVTQLVDWWKDHDDVRKMEEYTQYIGVCRDCFDSRTSVGDAPRKHHYGEGPRKRRSGELRQSEEFKRTSRVSKESRYDRRSEYHSSSDDERKAGYGSWVAAGLGAYGLGKVAGAFGANIKEEQRAARRKSSQASLNGRRRSGSRDRQSVSRRDSSRTDGRYAESSVTRKSSEKRRSTDRVDIVGGGDGSYRIERRRSTKAGSRSRSRSRDRHTGALGALGGAAAAAAVMSAVGRSSERRRSTEKIRMYDRSDSDGRTLSRGVGPSRPSGDGASVASGPLRRRRSQEKKKRGFFSFGNGSSSSEGGLTYGMDVKQERRQARADRRPKRKTSDEKMKATILGIGATAAALSAAQAGKTPRPSRSNATLGGGSEVVAVRQRKSRRSDDEGRRRRQFNGKSSADDEEDVWQDVSGDERDDYSDGMSGLAYGDFDYKGKARKSTDSLVSSSSGTSNWFWRWPRKKKRKPSVDSLLPVAAVAGAGAAAAALASRRNERQDGRSSAGSQPSMQSVYPVAGGDPYAYEAEGRYGSSSHQPVYATASGSVPLQQPQPIAPIGNGVYAAHSSSYVEPTGPPVEFNRRSSALKDASVAGAIATTAAAALANGKRNRDSQSLPSSVRFDLNQDQRFKEQGSDRERRRRDDDTRVQREEEERKRRHHREREEAEVAAAAAAAALLARETQQKAELEKQSSIRAEEERQRDRERRDRDRKEAREARELERRERQRLRDEQERRDAEDRAIEEEKRRARLAEEEFERKRVEDQGRREADLRELEARRRAREEDEKLQAAAQEAEKERFVREEEDRRVRDAAIHERPLPDDVESKRRRQEQIDRELEETERELERLRGKASSPEKTAVGGVSAGLVGVAAAAAAAGLYSASKRGDREPKSREIDIADQAFEPKIMADDRVAPSTVVEPKNPPPSVRHVEPSKVTVDSFDDDFDPDYFKKKRAAKEAALAQKAATKVMELKNAEDMFDDFTDRYTEKAVDQEDFWAPDVLKDKSVSAPVRSPNADADVEIFHVGHGVSGRPPYEPEYAFTASRDGKGPNNAAVSVPRLNLIEPTPPASRVNTPLVQAKDAIESSSPTHEVIPEAEIEDLVSAPLERSNSKVTWGENETYTYDVPTPLSFGGSKEDLASLAKAQSEKEKNKNKRNESSGSVVESDLETPAEEIGRGDGYFDVDDADIPVIEAESPEASPRVIEPRSAREQEAYRKPFFESVSDLGVGARAASSPAPDVDIPLQRRGYVEGEVFDETPAVEKDLSKGMPGGFVDEDEALETPGRSVEDDSPSVGKSKKSKKESKKEKKGKKSKKSKHDDEDEEVEAPVKDMEGLSLLGKTAGAAAVAGAINAFDYLDSDDKNPKRDDESRHIDDSGYVSRHRSIHDLDDEAQRDIEPSRDVPEPQDEDFSFPIKKDKKKKKKRRDDDEVEDESVPPPASEIVTAEPESHERDVQAEEYGSKKDRKKKRRDNDEAEVEPVLPPSSEVTAKPESYSRDVQPEEYVSKKDEKKKKKRRSVREEDFEEPSTPISLKKPDRYEEPESPYTPVVMGSFPEATPETGGLKGAKEDYFDDAVEVNEGRKRSKRDKGDIDDDRRDVKVDSAENDASSQSATRKARRDEEAVDNYPEPTPDPEELEPEEDSRRRKSSSRKSTQDDYFDDTASVHSSKRRSKHDDEESRSTVSNSRSEEGESRRKKSSSRKSTHDDLDDDTASVRSSKRRSKRDEDDTASVASYRSSTSKSSKAAGILGLFRSKSEDKDTSSSKSSRSRNDDEKNEDDDKERRRKKHSSRHGSDDDEKSSKSSYSRRADSTKDTSDAESTRSKRKHKSRSKDDDASREDRDRDERKYSRYSEQPPDDLVDDVLSHTSDRDREVKTRDEDESFLGERAGEAVPLPELERLVDEKSEIGEKSGKLMDVVLPAAATAAAFALMSEGKRRKEKKKKGREGREGRRELSPDGDEERVVTEEGELALEGVAPLVDKGREITSESAVQSSVEGQTQSGVIGTESPQVSRSLDKAETDLPSLPASRPSSPVEVGSLNDLPELPSSRPNSPTEELRNPRTPPRLNLQSQRAQSTTAVPLRLRRPLASPARLSSPESPISPQRSRHSKSSSWDAKNPPRFRGSEIKPLYLAERTRKGSNFSVDERFPPLPESRESSRDPGERLPGDEEEDVMVPTAEEAEQFRSFSFPQTPEEEDRRILGSHESTPRAVPVRNDASVEPFSLRESALAATALTGAALVAAHELSSRGHQSQMEDDFMAGVPSDSEPTANRGITESPHDDFESSSRSTLTRKSSSKKGKKGKKSLSFSEEVDGPAVLTAEDHQRIREQDALDAVDGWTEATSQPTMSVAELESGTAREGVPEPVVPAALLQRSKGKGKKKGKKSGKSTAQDDDETVVTEDSSVLELVASALVLDEEEATTMAESLNGEAEVASIVTPEVFDKTTVEDLPVDDDTVYVEQPATVTDETFEFPVTRKKSTGKKGKKRPEDVWDDEPPTENMAPSTSTHAEPSRLAIGTETDDKDDIAPIGDNEPRELPIAETREVAAANDIEPAKDDVDDTFPEFSTKKSKSKKGKKAQKFAWDEADPVVEEAPFPTPATTTKLDAALDLSSEKETLFNADQPGPADNDSGPTVLDDSTPAPVQDDDQIFSMPSKKGKGKKGKKQRDEAWIEEKSVEKSVVETEEAPAEQDIVAREVKVEEPEAEDIPFVSGKKSKKDKKAKKRAQAVDLWADDEPREALDQDEETRPAISQTVQELLEAEPETMTTSHNAVEANKTLDEPRQVEPIDENDSSFTYGKKKKDKKSKKRQQQVDPWADAPEEPTPSEETLAESPSGGVVQTEQPEVLRIDENDTLPLADATPAPQAEWDLPVKKKGKGKKSRKGLQQDEEFDAEEESGTLQAVAEAAVVEAVNTPVPDHDQDLSDYKSRADLLAAPTQISEDAEPEFDFTTAKKSKKDKKKKKVLDLWEPEPEPAAELIPTEEPQNESSVAFEATPEIPEIRPNVELPEEIEAPFVTSKKVKGKGKKRQKVDLWDEVAPAVGAVAAGTVIAGVAAEAGRRSHSVGHEASTSSVSKDVSSQDVVDPAKVPLPIDDASATVDTAEDSGVVSPDKEHSEYLESASSPALVPLPSDEEGDHFAAKTFDPSKNLRRDQSHDDSQSPAHDVAFEASQIPLPDSAEYEDLASAPRSPEIKGSTLVAADDLKSPIVQIQAGDHIEPTDIHESTRDTADALPVEPTDLELPGAFPEDPVEDSWSSFTIKPSKKKKKGKKSKIEESREPVEASLGEEPTDKIIKDADQTALELPIDDDDAAFLDPVAPTDHSSRSVDNDLQHQPPIDEEWTIRPSKKGKKSKKGKLNPFTFDDEAPIEASAQDDTAVSSDSPAGSIDPTSEANWDAPTSKKSKKKSKKVLPFDLADPDGSVAIKDRFEEPESSVAASILLPDEGLVKAESQDQAHVPIEDEWAAPISKKDEKKKGRKSKGLDDFEPSSLDTLPEPTVATEAENPESGATIAEADPASANASSNVDDDWAVPLSKKDKKKKGKSKTPISPTDNFEPELSPDQVPLPGDSVDEAQSLSGKDVPAGLPPPTNEADHDSAMESSPREKDGADQQLGDWAPILSKKGKKKGKKSKVLFNLDGADEHSQPEFVEQDNSRDLELDEEALQTPVEKTRDETPSTSQEATVDTNEYTQQLDVETLAEPTGDDISREIESNPIADTDANEEWAFTSKKSKKDKKKAKAAALGLVSAVAGAAVAATLLDHRTDIEPNASGHAVESEDPTANADIYSCDMSDRDLTAGTGGEPDTGTLDNPDASHDAEFEPNARSEEEPKSIPAIEEAEEWAELPKKGKKGKKGKAKKAAFDWTLDEAPGPSEPSNEPDLYIDRPTIKDNEIADPPAEVVKSAPEFHESYVPADGSSTQPEAPSASASDAQRDIATPIDEQIDAIAHAIPGAFEEEPEPISMTTDAPIDASNAEDRDVDRVDDSAAIPTLLDALAEVTTTEADQKATHDASIEPADDADEWAIPAKVKKGKKKGKRLDFDSPAPPSSDADTPIASSTPVTIDDDEWAVPSKKSGKDKKKKGRKPLNEDLDAINEPIAPLELLLSEDVHNKDAYPLVVPVAKDEVESSDFALPSKGKKGKKGGRSPFAEDDTTATINGDHILNDSATVDPKVDDPSVPDRAEPFGKPETEVAITADPVNLEEEETEAWPTYEKKKKGKRSKKMDIEDPPITSPVIEGTDRAAEAQELAESTVSRLAESGVDIDRSIGEEEEWPTYGKKKRKSKKSRMQDEEESQASTPPIIEKVRQAIADLPGSLDLQTADAQKRSLDASDMPADTQAPLMEGGVEGEANTELQLAEDEAPGTQQPDVMSSRSVTDAAPMQEDEDFPTFSVKKSKKDKKSKSRKETQDSQIEEAATTDTIAAAALGAATIATTAFAEDHTVTEPKPSAFDTAKSMEDAIGSDREFSFMSQKDKKKAKKDKKFAAAMTDFEPVNVSCSTDSTADNITTERAGEDATTGFAGESNTVVEPAEEDFGLSTKKSKKDKKKNRQAQQVEEAASVEKFVNSMDSTEPSLEAGPAPETIASHAAADEKAMYTATERHEVTQFNAVETLPTEDFSFSTNKAKKGKKNRLEKDPVAQEIVSTPVIDGADLSPGAIKPILLAQEPQVPTDEVAEGAEAADIDYFSVKKSKKDKKKAKASKAAIEPVAMEQSPEHIEQSAVDLDTHDRAIDQETSAVQVEQDDWTNDDFSSKKSKKDKKKAKKGLRSLEGDDELATDSTANTLPPTIVPGVQPDAAQGAIHEPIAIPESDTYQQGGIASTRDVTESELTPAIFDPAAILTDPVFSRPSSRARALEEPDFDELPLQASRMSSRSGSRRPSRRSSSMTRMAEAEKSYTANESSLPIDSNEFAAVLAAGLQGAGFDPDVVHDDPSFQRRQAEGHDKQTGEPDFSEYHRKDSKKAKKGKKNKAAIGSVEGLDDKNGQLPLIEGKQPSADSMPDPPAYVRDLEASRSIPAAAQEVEDEWALPMKKSRKGKKGAKGRQEDAEEVAKLTTRDIEAPSAAHTSSVPMQHERNIDPREILLGAGGLAAATALATANMDHHNARSFDPDADFDVDNAGQQGKRKAPPRQNSMAHTAKRLSISDGSRPRSISDIQSRSRSDTYTVVDKHLLPDAQSDNNRDSAVLLEDALPRGSLHASDHVSVRDSGYHDEDNTPTTPSMLRSSRELEQTPESKKARRLSHSEPIKVQVEVPTDWEVDVHDQTPIDHHAVRRVEHEAPSRQHDDVSASRSLGSDAPITPNPRSTPRATLDTIVENSPDSPLAKRSRHSTNISHTDRSPKTKRSSLGTAAVSAGALSMGHLIDNRAWPEVNEHRETVDGIGATTSSPHLTRGLESPTLDHTNNRLASPNTHARPPSVASDRSAGFARLRSPELRSPSAMSTRSLGAMSARSDKSIRRVSDSPDLRAASKAGETYLRSTGAKFSPPVAPQPSGSPDYFSSKSRGSTARGLATMDGYFEGRGDAPASPMSPSRPPSVRKRQSLQLIDLQSRHDQLVSENRMLQDAKLKADQVMQGTSNDRELHATSIRQATEAIASREQSIREKEDLLSQMHITLEQLQQEVARLTTENAELTDRNTGLANGANERFTQLSSEHAELHSQWQESARSLATLQAAHHTMSQGMEQIVKDEIASALEDRNAEIARITAELDAAMNQINILQAELVKARQSEDFLTVRDEDYFDSACQQLCQHVQQWVLRFSKFSDNRACRLSSDIKDDKIEARLDDAILDGSDVDQLLADRIKRRDVFMSLVMSMIWEYVFTRYLFGMDREQRQKLKNLEKTLTDVGPQRAVAQWRAITLTLLANRDVFRAQREQDTEAVVQEIYDTLAKLLPPPSHLVTQIQTSLRNVMKLAVSLAIEMRCQRAEYIMLPPLKPEYDTNGDLVQKVFFNSALMNERSGEVTSNEVLEERQATVRVVLFPLVVKKGDDYGEGEDEIVVCPAQVLVAKPRGDKRVVRVMSGAMEIDRQSSMASLMPTTIEEAQPF